MTIMARPHIYVVDLSPEVVCCLVKVLRSLSANLWRRIIGESLRFIRGAEG